MMTLMNTEHYILVDTRTDKVVLNPDGTELVIKLPVGEYHLEWKEIPVDNPVVGVTK